MYWPGMTADIRQYIETSGTSSTYQDKQAQEEQIITSVPALPWLKLAVDIGFPGGKDYLIMTDYRSNFLEFDILPDLQASTVVMKLKMQSARHGIPETVVSDK